MSDTQLEILTRTRGSSDVVLGKFEILSVELHEDGRFYLYGRDRNGIEAEVRVGSRKFEDVPIVPARAEPIAARMGRR